MRTLQENENAYERGRIVIVTWQVCVQIKNATLQEEHDGANSIQVYGVQEDILSRFQNLHAVTTKTGSRRVHGKVFVDHVRPLECTMGTRAFTNDRQKPQHAGMSMFARVAQQRLNDLPLCFRFPYWLVQKIYIFQNETQGSWSCTCKTVFANNSMNTFSSPCGKTQKLMFRLACLR